MPKPTRVEIANLWMKDGKGGDHELHFYLDYAAYCIAVPEEITGIVEAMQPSQFGCFELGLCISDRLSGWVYKYV